MRHIDLEVCGCRICNARLAAVKISSVGRCSRGVVWTKDIGGWIPLSSAATWTLVKAEERGEHRSNRQVVPAPNKLLLARMVDILVHGLLHCMYVPSFDLAQFAQLKWSARCLPNEVILLARKPAFSASLSGYFPLGSGVMTLLLFDGNFV